MYPDPFATVIMQRGKQHDMTTHAPHRAYVPSNYAHDVGFDPIVANRPWTPSFRTCAVPTTNAVRQIALSMLASVPSAGERPQPLNQQCITAGETVSVECFCCASYLVTSSPHSQSEQRHLLRHKLQGELWYIVRTSTRVLCGNNLRRRSIPQRHLPR